MQNSKKLKAVAIVLIVFLALRVLGQLFVNVPAFMSDDDTMFLGMLSFLFAIAYGIGIFTTVKRLEWGTILLLITFGVDVLAALMLAGLVGAVTFATTSAIFWDVVLAALVWQDRKEILGHGGSAQKSNMAVPPIGSGSASHEDHADDHDHSQHA